MNNRYPLSIWILILALLSCFVIMLLESIGNQLRPTEIEPWISGTAETPGVVEETLTVPVNTEVFTTHRYAGWVTITVRGEGQINDNTRHDAFYRYTDEQYLGPFYGFEINGASLVPSILNSPPRKTEQGYQFLYPMGLQPLRLGFRVLNGNEQDTSEFIVEVSTENKVSPRGR